MRRVIHRIPAQNQQRIHRTRIHVRAKFAQRLQVIHRAYFYRLGVINRRPHIPERGIDSVRQGVHFRRLLLARHHQRTAAMRCQVRTDCPQERVCSGRSLPAARAAVSQFSRQRPREHFHLRSPNW